MFGLFVANPPVKKSRKKSGKKRKPKTITLKGRRKRMVKSNRRGLPKGLLKKYHGDMKKAWKAYGKKSKSNPRKKRKKSRAKSNTWFKQPLRHSWAKKYGSAKRPKKRATKRRARSNPVLPISYNRKRRKTRARRNPVLPISYNAYASNPAAAMDVAKEVVSLNFWTETVLPLGVGFIGSRVASAQLSGILGVEAKGIAKHAVNIAASAIVGGLGTMLVNKKFGTAALAGGLVNAFYDILSDLIGGTEIGSAIGLKSGLSDLTENAKNEIAAGIRQSYQGVSDYATAQDIAAAPHLRGVADYATAQELAAAPQLAPVSEQVVTGGALDDYEDDYM